MNRFLSRLRCLLGGHRMRQQWIKRDLINGAAHWTVCCRCAVCGKVE